MFYTFVALPVTHFFFNGKIAKKIILFGLSLFSGVIFIIVFP